MKKLWTSKQTGTMYVQRFKTETPKGVPETTEPLVILNVFKVGELLPEDQYIVTLPESLVEFYFNEVLPKE